MFNKDILLKFITSQQQKTQPIVTDQGFKNGAPPEGTNWRIPSDTLYNPTPHRIKAVSDNGIEKTLEPGDTTNVQFPGAKYVDEYELPKAQEGLEYLDQKYNPSVTWRNFTNNFNYARAADAPLTYGNDLSYARGNLNSGFSINRLDNQTSGISGNAGYSGKHFDLSGNYGRDGETRSKGLNAGYNGEHFNFSGNYNREGDSRTKGFDTGVNVGRFSSNVSRTRTDNNRATGSASLAYDDSDNGISAGVAANRSDDADEFAGNFAIKDFNLSSKMKKDSDNQHTFSANTGFSHNNFSIAAGYERTPLQESLLNDKFNGSLSLGKYFAKGDVDRMNGNPQHWSVSAGKTQGPFTFSGGYTNYGGTNESINGSVGYNKGVNGITGSLNYRNNGEDADTVGGSLGFKSRYLNGNVTYIPGEEAHYTGKLGLNIGPVNIGASGTYQGDHLKITPTASVAYTFKEEDHPRKTRMKEKMFGGDADKYDKGGRVKRKSVDAPTADYESMNNPDKRAEYEAGWNAYSQGAQQWVDMLNREEDKKGRELTNDEKEAFIEKYVKPAEGQRKFNYDRANDRSFDFLFDRGYNTWNSQANAPEFVFRKPVKVEATLNELDKKLQKHNSEWLKSEDTPFGRSLGFDPTKSNEAKERAFVYANTKVAEELLAKNPQGDRSRVEWMNSFTPQERSIIESGQAAYKFEPGLGTQFMSGLEKNVRNIANIATVGPTEWYKGNNQFNTALWGNNDLTKEEQDNASAMGIAAPLMYGSNLVRGAVTGDGSQALAGSVSKPLFYGDRNSYIDPKGASTMNELLTAGMDPTVPITALAESGAIAKGVEALQDLPGVNKMYKLNPNAKGSYFKPWEGSTRIINQAGFDDALENFAIRSAPEGNLPTGPIVDLGNGQTAQMAGRPTAWPSFSRKPNPTYLTKGQDNFIVETQHPVALSTKGRHGKGTTLFPVDAEGNFLTQIPIEDTQIYHAKPHFWNGYQKAWENPLELDMSKLKVGPGRVLVDEHGNPVAINLAESGAFNSGVYEHPTNPNYVIKAEAPEITQEQFIPKYSEINFQDLHQGIKSPNIGKVVKFQTSAETNANPLKVPNLQMMRRMPGTGFTKLTAEEIRDIPMEAYEQLWKDAKELRNNNMAIDLIGDNIMYDKVKKQFKIIDASPLVDTDGFSNWTEQILKGQKPGLTPQESAKFLANGIANKLYNHHLHKLAAQDIGQRIDYENFLQNVGNQWMKMGPYKNGGVTFVNPNLEKFLNR